MFWLELRGLPLVTNCEVNRREDRSSLIDMASTTGRRDWYSVGKEEGYRAGRFQTEIQRSQNDFQSEDDATAWIEGLNEGVSLAGARITAMTVLKDQMPGSARGFIHVLYVERHD